jgi:hypothetical protein
MVSEEEKSCLTLSGVCSIAAALLSEAHNGKIDYGFYFQPADSNWRLLPDEKYDRLMKELSVSYNLDSPKSSREKDALLVDGWGNRYNIAYRQFSDLSYDFVVISKGPDGVYGTKDDEVSGNASIAPEIINNRKQP